MPRPRKLLFLTLLLTSCAFRVGPHTFLHTDVAVKRGAASVTANVFSIERRTTHVKHYGVYWTAQGLTTESKTYLYATPQR